MSSFSSSSFDVVTTATTTNAALADDAEAPEKGGDGRDSGEQRALPRAADRGGGVGCSPTPHQPHSKLLSPIDK